MAVIVYLAARRRLWHGISCEAWGLMACQNSSLVSVREDKALCRRVAEAFAGFPLQDKEWVHRQG